MRFEVEEVRAWVDGELSEPRAGEVANAVQADENLNQLAKTLRASILPYREAYEQVRVPDVPMSLRKKIEALQEPTPTHEAPKTHWFKTAGIAASVMMALFIGYMAGANFSGNALTTTTASNDDLLHPENFAQTVAAYQTFYVRETLKGFQSNPVQVAERLENQTGMQVIIPELEGYDFIRAQRLSFDGETLLQLVYLGADGGPLALCYMMASGTNAQSDHPAATVLKKHHGLNTAEWHHNGHRFVIVSDAAEQKLDTLSQSTREQWDI